MSLIALPNGDYVRTENVIAIRKGDREPSAVGGPEHPWRVIVDFGFEGRLNSIVISCEDQDERDGIMRDIAQKCGVGQ